jgi:hypothetical protein
LEHLQVYGIELRPVDDTWWPYVVIVSEPPFVSVRGPLGVLASEATGWSGIVASQIVPALRNRYYLGLSVFLVGYGLLVDWRLARDWNNKSRNSYMRLRCVLKELKKQRMTPANATPNGEAAESE